MYTVYLMLSEKKDFLSVSHYKTVLAACSYLQGVASLVTRSYDWKILCREPHDII